MHFFLSLNLLNSFLHNKHIYCFVFCKTIPQSIGSVVLLGVFLGFECLVCFILGLNLVGVFICFNSLIIGYSVKNAREFDRTIGRIADVDEASIQADIMVTASEGIPGTALIAYLLFITLFFMQGAQKWGAYGYFRKWIDSGELSTLTEDISDPFLTKVNQIPDMIKDAFDGENVEASSSSETTED